MKFEEIDNMIKRLKEIIQKLTPKNLVDGKCPNCDAKVPNGQPFWCPGCKQALNYPENKA